MRSALPKVAHPVAGRAMVAHVVRAVRAAGADRIVVVVGHGADAVRDALTGEPVAFALQAEQLGTGHALACARAALADHHGPIFVLNGDGPLLRPATLAALADRRAAEAPDGMALATVVVDDPSGLGRIVRDAGGALAAIVEEADADAATRALREVNPGVYLVGSDVWGYLGELRADNAQGEVYVTDLPLRYLAAGRPVVTEEVADAEEVLGANDRVQLARLEAIARRRIVERWMRAGVTIEQPESAWIDDDVELARDVTIEPFVVLRAGTRVGEGARIGAFAHLSGCRVAAGTQVPPRTSADRADLT